MTRTQKKSARRKTRPAVREFVAAPVTSPRYRVDKQDTKVSSCRGILAAIGAFFLTIWDFATDFLYGVAIHAIPYLKSIPKYDTPYVVAIIVFAVIGVLSLIIRWKAGPSGDYHAGCPQPPPPPHPHPHYPHQHYPHQHYPQHPNSPHQEYPLPPDSQEPPQGPSAFD